MGYFGEGFRYSGQLTTYMALMSSSWRILCLDTAYEFYVTTGGFLRPNLFDTKEYFDVTDSPEPEEIMIWLRDVVLRDPTDKRGIVIFTHHQPHSNWVERVWPGTARQLNELLAGRTVVWFFGHEHRFAIYEKMRLKWAPTTEDVTQESSFEVFPRMIGHGGYIVERGRPFTLKGLRAWDNQLYQVIAGQGSGRHLSSPRDSPGDRTPL